MLTSARQFLMRSTLSKADPADRATHSLVIPSNLRMSCSNSTSLPVNIRSAAITTLLASSHNAAIHTVNFVATSLVKPSERRHSTALRLAWTFRTLPHHHDCTLPAQSPMRSAYPIIAVSIWHPDPFRPTSPPPAGFLVAPGLRWFLHLTTFSQSALSHLSTPPMPSSQFTDVGHGTPPPPASASVWLHRRPRSRNLGKSSSLRHLDQRPICLCSFQLPAHRGPRLEDQTRRGLQSRRPSSRLPTA